MRKYLLPVAAASFAVIASSSYAAQTSDNFQARITIVTSCIVTAADLDFGNVGVIVGGETATAAVNVNCSAGTPYTLSFDPLLSVTAYTGTMVNACFGVGSATMQFSSTAVTATRTSSFQGWVTDANTTIQAPAQLEVQQEHSA